MRHAANKKKGAWQVARTQTGYAVGVLCGSLFLATLSQEPLPTPSLEPFCAV